MSATNRGAIRRESDFYRTPAGAINAFLDVFEFLPFNSIVMPFRLVLDPCAGDGAIIREINKRMTDNMIAAVEIRPEEKDNLLRSGADWVYISDFLKWEPEFPFDVIISNPPYSIAQKIIEHCFEIAPDAEVIMLLRQGFLSSKARKPFWDKHPVTQLYPLVERPSFGASVKCKKCDWRRFYHLGEDYPRRCPECGANIQVSKTDACDYAWFVWSKYREQKIEVIIRRDENVCES